MMNMKVRIHIFCFEMFRRRRIFRAVSVALAIIFLSFFLYFAWLMGDISIFIKTVASDVGAENDVSLPVSEDIPSEWILFGQETVDEIFAGLTASDDSALPVLATTVRPYHWMSQYEGIAVNNESERIFNIEDLLSEKVSIEMSAEDGPQILIVHTHGTESYNSGSLNKYYTTDKLRSTDISENVVAIGDRVAELLSEAGYSVVHDKTMHDDGNYNGSYASSRRSISEHLEKYPSIKIVLDIHRDTVITEKAVKYRTIWEYNGSSAAQVMILLGSGGSRFANDHWEENLKLALLIQQRAEEIYPDLMRPILMRSSLYNQDLCNGGILVEIGTCGNTFTEALLGAECFTECLRDVLDILCEG